MCRLFVFICRGTYRVDGATGAPLTLGDREGEVEVRDNEVDDGPVRFRHDPRLVLSTRVYLTNEQVVSAFCVRKC